MVIQLQLILLGLMLVVQLAGHEAVLSVHPFPQRLELELLLLQLKFVQLVLLSFRVLEVVHVQVSLYQSLVGLRQADLQFKQELTEQL